MSQKKIKTQRANEKNPVNKTRKAPIIVAVNLWYNVPVDEKIFGKMPVLDANMNVTYTNRREHLTDWMIRLLQGVSKKDFKICNQKLGRVKIAENLLIKDNIYLSTIPKDADAIKTLTFVDYYAFDYAGVTNQLDTKFLNSPKFNFDKSNYVDLKPYNLHQMNASGNENSCGFFALLQAISPLYRALNYPAKIFITHEFRNSYVPTIIVNEQGAPMSTKDYKTPSMGGNATTNELDVIRNKYNEYDSETSGKHKFIEYLNGSQNTQFTGISMHIRNSWFFGFNVVSISAKTQNSVTGKYKFFKDEIEGPQPVNETIFICNISSAHYMTIGIENAAGEIDFIFDETNPDIKKMIDDISIKGTPTDVVKPNEQDLTFENIKIKDITRKILNNQKTDVTIDIILYKPETKDDNFPKQLDISIVDSKMYGNVDNTEVGGNSLLCLAFDRTTNKYYYVLSYELSKVDPDVEIYHVASITKVDKKLTIANGYTKCGTIQYHNTKDAMVVNLNVCDLPAPPPNKTIIVAVTKPHAPPPNKTIIGVSPPTPPPNPTIIGVSPDPTIISVSKTASLGPPPKTVIPIVPLVPPPTTAVKSVPPGPSTCVILVKFNGALDVESVNINPDVNNCKTASLFPDDFSTIVPGQDYLFTIDYDPANPSVSTVTESKTQLQCDATNNLKTKLDALFAA